MPAAPATAAAASAAPPQQLRIVLEVLAKASGRPVEQLRPEMDLRYDLALRSSRFPLIIQEAEQRLGLTINFEDLLQVATIGDLARVLGAAEHGAAQGKKAAINAAGPARPLPVPAPLRRSAALRLPAMEKGRLRPPARKRNRVSAPPCVRLLWIPAARACRSGVGMCWRFLCLIRPCCRAC